MQSGVEAQKTRQVTSALIQCVELYAATFSFNFRSPFQWDKESKLVYKPTNVRKRSTFPWLFLSFIWLPITGLGSVSFICIRKFYHEDQNIKIAKVFTLITYSFTILWSFCLGYFCVIKWVDDMIDWFNSTKTLLIQLQNCK